MYTERPPQFPPQNRSAELCRHLKPSHPRRLLQLAITQDCINVVFAPPRYPGRGGTLLSIPPRTRRPLLAPACHGRGI